MTSKNLLKFWLRDFGKIGNKKQVETLDLLQGVYSISWKNVDNHLRRFQIYSNGTFSHHEWGSGNWYLNEDGNLLLAEPNNSNIALFTYGVYERVYKACDLCHSKDGIRLLGDFSSVCFCSRDYYYYKD